MPVVAGRFKGTDFIIKGEVDERLPRVTSGLIAHFPFDGTIHDRMVEYYRPSITTTNRDWADTYFPNHYNYSGMKFLITGKLLCEEAANWNVDVSIRIAFKQQDDTTNYLVIKTWKLKDVQNRWLEFTTDVVIPSTYKSNLRPYLVIQIPDGTPGYKVHFEDLNYLLIDDGDYITTENVDSTQEFLSVREASQNYLVNGNFSNKLTNWSIGAPVTTHEYIYTPYGPGVRVSVGDGNSGDWPLRYTGPTPDAFNAGETWVWSFKYKTVKGISTRPFSIGYWIRDVEGLPMLAYIPIVETPLEEDGWFHASASYRFQNSHVSPFSHMGFNSFLDHSIVDIVDVRLENRTFPTCSPDNGSGNGKLAMDVPILPTHSLSAERKFASELGWTKHGLTKDISNNFVYYKNGLPTTEFQNMWTSIKVRGVGINRNQGYGLSVYTDPFEKTLMPEPIYARSKLNEDDCGYLLRTFVYAATPVTVNHKYRADNYAGMRVNNGSLRSLGGWDANTNPIVPIDLVEGWNLIEISYMDGDNGGSLTRVEGVPFNEYPEVLYMTAELPIEMSSGKVHFNEKSNTDIRNMSIYNKALNENDMKAIHTSKGISITETGDVKMVIKEALPYIPTGSYHFPLGQNAKDATQTVSAVKAENIVYEDGWAWVGLGVQNFVANGDGKLSTSEYSVPGTFQPGWSPAEHPYAILVDGWSTGYNGGVESPTTGYHAQWVREGIDGDMDPCMKFVNRNDVFGYPSRWLGISQGINTTLSGMGVTHGQTVSMSWAQRGTRSGTSFKGGLLCRTPANTTMWANSGPTLVDVLDVNSWETAHVPVTIDSTIDLTRPFNFYLYGDTGVSGIKWADNFMLTKNAFYKPFTNSFRASSLLEFNFHETIGLKWNEDWSIVYFKKPIGTAADNMVGYSIESIGSGSNTVGGGYLWWGKDSNANTLAESTNNPIVPAQYFNNERMVSVVCKNGTATIKEWDQFGKVQVRTVAGLTSPASSVNRFVNQYGYDFMLGGWNNQGSSNSFYRDLIVAKRAFSDEEVERLFKTRYSSREDGLYVSGRVISQSTLT